MLFLYVRCQKSFFSPVIDAREKNVRKEKSTESNKKMPTYTEIVFYIELGVDLPNGIIFDISVLLSAM